ncbi:hypothetical protein MAR_035003 [Mya arenaria]|uniref:Uncharacterized protein n=1 Tax=Mya arenaria TaxID=6604 RepID=A0ABY7ELS6_MYAAR|nr:hypothetical protein MAR_035003 [Mya arenaria]
MTDTATRGKAATPARIVAAHLSESEWVNPVLITQVRYKFKTQRPKQQIMEKRIFEEIMAPLYDKERIPYKSCADLQRRRMEEEQVDKSKRQLTQGTKLENLAPLLTSNNILITSPNVAIHEFMKATKKMPEIILLGGFVGDRLVTKDQMTHARNGRSNNGDRRRYGNV